MDPEACLLAARIALDDMKFDAFLDCLADYAGWRKRGGFEPTIRALNVETRGDVFYGLLATRYGALVGSPEFIPGL